MKWRLAGLALVAGPAAAQGLTGDWGGARTSLAASGVSLRADVTGFATGQIAGTGDKVWDAFGRYDAFVDLDFGKMGLVDGLGFHAHGEGRFGQGQSNFGFQLGRPTPPPCCHWAAKALPPPRSTSPRPSASAAS